MKINNVKELLEFLSNFSDDDIVVVEDGEIKVFLRNSGMSVKSIKESVDFVNEDQKINIPCDGIIKISNNYHIQLDDSIDVVCDQEDNNNVYSYYKNNTKLQVNDQE